MNESKSFVESIASFDYEALGKEQEQIIQQLTQEIRDCLRRSAQDIWEIGQKLADVRDRLKYGQFDTWLKTEFGWSRRTAYNFISVYQTFGERANLAKVNIATSALYLLSAPSTSQKVREEFLQKARSGETITYKQLSEVIQKEKSATQATVEIENVEEKPLSIKPEIMKIIPKVHHSVCSSSEEATTFSEPSNTSLIQNIQRGWYCLEYQNFLFCGDTASSQFVDNIPYASLAIAITTDDWDHDWLVDKAKSVLIFPENQSDSGLITQLITLFTEPGQMIIFPWLPNPDMIAIAHLLNRKIFAGDPSVERCQLAVQRSQLYIADSQTCEILLS
ncbi:MULTISPECIES: DUF3102 domain-containing protein [Crocosphaera]|uniref:DUF3102 domain-containing protein n=6 Tax=Crocosphaera watsonii TaxID=263511 RepID=Q4C6B8_CROWT|nr:MULTISPECIES: DUF3102 domain-containing protein [Crocosphaera]EAM51525.1 unknown protein [Crocosphaera watsonii WH 8501]EHJ13658.1 hypothetical protein CWATWH0003_1655 [Crocosphaera watsonii WH 0003]MCH2244571.1 DUF3102 domain-containing protein [Crocosphaera sp.]NQZ61105.1 DUF3102 domain-containing protein [Crocosphaera sp.]CCQ48983.1 FIG00556477: hypothetical protein [Crocosphaera watsonii WH 8502]